MSLRRIFSRPISFLLIAISLDLVIVALHIFFGYKTDFFNLDNEMNFPTFYQGIKLFIVGFFLLYTFLKTWLMVLVPLAILLIYLGVDEIMQIHENFSSIVKNYTPSLAFTIEDWIKNLNYKSSKWVIYLAPVIFATILYIFFVSFWSRLKKYDSFFPFATRCGFLFAGYCF